MIKLFANTPHPVEMEVFVPPSTVASSGKSAVVAYGTDGLSPASKPMIEEFCRDLAAVGHTVVLPRYLERTHTPPGLSTVTSALTSANLALWTEALVEAVNWCKTNQSGTQVALIGFSLGGYIAARCAIVTNPNCFIDFFGPMTTFGEIQFPLGEAFDALKASRLPRTQIHHGDLDKIVLPSESRTLSSWLSTSQIPCDLHDQYACGHPQQPDVQPWSLVEQHKATQDVIAFL